MIATIVLAAAASAATMKPGAIVFPCKPGKMATYRARGKWEEGSGMSSVISRKLLWPSRYLKCSNSPTRSVALVQGLPMDLAWYSLGQGSNLYAIIQTAGGLYIQQLHDRHIKLKNIAPSPDDKYLRFPVKAGECAQKSNQRPDGMYCWFVDSVKKMHGRTLWAISYGSLADSSSIEIEPGVGIVSYQYMHHGTIATVKAQLVRKKQ